MGLGRRIGFRILGVKDDSGIVHTTIIVGPLLDFQTNRISNVVTARTKDHSRFLGGIGIGGQHSELGGSRLQLPATGLSVRAMSQAIDQGFEDLWGLIGGEGGDFLGGGFGSKQIQHRPVQQMRPFRRILGHRQFFIETTTNKVFPPIGFDILWLTVISTR